MGSGLRSKTLIADNHQKDGQKKEPAKAHLTQSKDLMGESGTEVKGDPRKKDRAKENEDELDHDDIPLAGNWDFDWDGKGS